MTLHGYTLRDLDGIARSACMADRSLASDVTTRFGVAWSAIAEHLCTAVEPPTWQDLVRIGWQAIYQEVREMRHTFGQMRDDPNAPTASMPRAQQYWFVPASDPEEAFVERLAVGQVLDTLKQIDRETILALAVHDDYRRAAESLGLKYATFTQRMSVARRAFRRQWFAPDPAPPIRGTDRRVEAYDKAPQTHCLRGHEMSGDNVRLRRDGKGRVCRACERDRKPRKGA